jgi:integrase
MKLKVPYFKWRDGRPRWEPGPLLRKRKWKGRDLKDVNGKWLDYGHAINAAIALNNEVAAWRARDGSGTRSNNPPLKKVPRACRALADLWYKTPEFRRLAESTRDDYRKKLEVFLASPFDPDDEDNTATYADVPVAALGRANLKGYWRVQYDARGHSMANGIIAVVRAMLTFGTDLEWIAVNPAFKLKIAVVDARVAFWSPAKVKAFVETADSMEHQSHPGLRMHSVADALILALHSAQRQGDVLAMAPRIFDAKRIALSQHKTSALVDIAMTPPLLARVAAIRERWRAQDILTLEALVVDERTGKRYVADAFRKAFRRVRAETALRYPELCAEERFQPGIDKLRFQDLRDTAVTRLATAPGNDAVRVAAISGHTVDHVYSVIKHYLAVTSPLADEAVDNLVAWMLKEGIEL